MDKAPFPQNLEIWTRLLFSGILIIVLCLGTRYRFVIFFFLCSPDARKNSVTILIWIEQLVGILFSLQVSFWSVVMVLPFPLVDIFGQTFCSWFPTFGNIRVTGAVVWSSVIAVYRILHIKAQKFVRHKLGEKKLLSVLLVVGCTLHIGLTTILTIYDDANLPTKACFQSSSLETDAFVAGSKVIFGRRMVQLVSLFGVVLTAIELSCYITFFHYIWMHDTTIAANVIKPSMLKTRKRSNAITMFGQFTSWLMQVWFIVAVGIFSTILGREKIREKTVIIKMLEYALLPIVQVYTSPPMKKYIKTRKQ